MVGSERGTISSERSRMQDGEQDAGRSRMRERSPVFDRSIVVTLNSVNIRAVAPIDPDPPFFYKEGWIPEQHRTWCSLYTRTIQKNRFRVRSSGEGERRGLNRLEEPWRGVWCQLTERKERTSGKSPERRSGAEEDGTS